MDETDQLYEDTRSIYEKFSPHRVKPIRDLTCDRAAAAQSVFSKALISGRETHGIELDEPTYKYVTFKKAWGGTAGSTLSESKWSISSDRSGQSLSGRSLASNGSDGVRDDRSGSDSVRDERPASAAAPKLPPRKIPREPWTELPPREIPREPSLEVTGQG